jgi:CRISPR-associated protein (TIGR03986 family)
VKVQDLSRCGRAPYNFVPEPNPPRPWCKAPSHELYDSERISGYIDLKFEAKSDFFIQGWRALEDHRKLKPTQDGKVPRVTDSFLINGKPGIPGSSLRGMVRTLFEILSMAPLEPINDRRMFYRAVGVSADNTDPSFEPQAERYKDLLYQNPIGNPSYPAAKVGLLEQDGPRWVIHPMKTQNIYRYADEKYNGNFGFWEVKFQKPPVPWDIVRGFPAGNGPTDGWLICSGLMPGVHGKHRQWVVHNDPDRTAGAEIKVEEDLRRDFLEEGVTQWMSSRGKGRNFEYHRNLKSGRPVFYVCDAGKLLGFGHTPFFRIPYAHTAESLRQKASEKLWGDMAKSVFGALIADGKSTRVFFEDACCTSDALLPPAEEKSVVLGSPKPTTYQHYLHQDSFKHNEIQFWDSNPQARLRGHKLYWHRPPAEYPVPPNNNQDVATKLKPVCQNDRDGEPLRFKSRIRFDNLSEEELGCLLLVFDLPNDAVERAHKIGMGKPLGLGSFKIKIDKIMSIPRKARYEKLLDNGGTLLTAEKPFDPGETAMYEAQFAAWYLGLAKPTDEESAKKLVCERFWTDLRMKELLAILSWPPPTGCDSTVWKKRTRYMGIEQARYGGRFDEYRKAWIENFACPAPRKPLPPATQVWTNNPAVPDDEYIPFEHH